MDQENGTTPPGLGEVLRAHRARLGLSLKQMSARTGLPFSTLAKIEQNRATLTYERLLQVSARLGMSVSDLLAPAAAPPAPPQVGGRRSLFTIEGGLVMDYARSVDHYLAQELRAKDMVPIVFEPRTRSLEEFGPYSRHSGQEFVLVLAGAIVVHTEFYDPVTLRAGEGIYFDSTMGHAYVLAPDAQTAKVLCVCSAPREEIQAMPRVAGPAAEPPSRPARAARTRRAVSGSGAGAAQSE